MAICPPVEPRRVGPGYNHIGGPFNLDPASRFPDLNQLRDEISKVALAFAPNGRQPRLPMARKPWWPEITLHLDESDGGDVIAPGVEFEEAAIAIAAKTFLVVSSRVRAEQDTSRFQGRCEFEQNPRQFLARHVEERRIGEHAVKAALRQDHGEKVLVENVTSGIGARHGDEFL